MSLPDQAEAPPAAAEVTRGRFAAHPQEQGFVIGYATGLCDRCLNCGCGEQQEPLDLTPGGMVAMARKLGKLKMLKGMIKL